MEIDKAYCIELNDEVTPYQAKYAFFDDNNTYEKFHFKCVTCDAEIYGANIYIEALRKQRPNFRTMPRHIHEINCPYKTSEEGSSDNHEGHHGSPKRFKGSPFPTELMLHVKWDGEGAKNGLNKDLDAEESDKNKKEKRSLTDKYSEGPTRTGIFEFVVDCFERATEEQKNTYSLTIGNKTKSYAAYFMSVKDFQDEKGLIYYGFINKKRFKKLNDGYRIVFEDMVSHNGKKLSISLYVSKKSIEFHRKKRYFELNMDKILSLSPNEEAMCYFVGYYPCLKGVPLKNNPSEKFLIYDAEIKNPNHLVIKFSDTGSR